jgi:hypothetical protein
MKNPDLHYCGIFLGYFEKLLCNLWKKINRDSFNIKYISVLHVS